MNAHTGFLLIATLLCGCQSGIGSLDPANGAGPNANLGLAGFPDSQTIVFQGQSDLGSDSPVQFDVPLPMGALESRLYLFGERFSTLHYTEIPLHTHAGISSVTQDFTDTHGHQIFSNDYVLNGSGFGGGSSVTLNGQCGAYRTFSMGNGACDNTRLVGLTTLTHHHDVTPQIMEAGVPALDDHGAIIPPTQMPKTYCDHVRVTLDGEDITGRFDVSPLGDGGKDHAMNTHGASAELTEALSQPGHHRVIFSIPDDGTLQSLGGGIRYVLWVRIPFGPWQPLTTGSGT